METRFIKDLAIALIFICLAAFAIKAYSIHKKEGKIADQSKYTDISVNEELIRKINTIEASIVDRKSFRFNVPTDPLRQDPVIKDRLDRLQEWENMVANLVRLSGTVVDEDKGAVAIIDHQGTERMYRVGDYIAGRRITKIEEGRVIYSIGGSYYTMVVEPKPQRPADLETGQDITEYNY